MSHRWVSSGACLNQLQSQPGSICSTRICMTSKYIKVMRLPARQSDARPCPRSVAAAVSVLSSDAWAESSTIILSPPDAYFSIKMPASRMTEHEQSSDSPGSLGGNMQHIRRVAKAGFLLLAFLVGSASMPQEANAHRPIFTEDKATGPETAIPIKDPQISQVVYREITKDSSTVWLAFEVPKDFRLFVQIGVPAIDRLKTFRPAMAIVGPGLPENDRLSHCRRAPGPWSC